MNRNGLINYMSESYGVQAVDSFVQYSDVAVISYELIKPDFRCS